MHDPNTWKCGHCAFNIPLPPPGAYLYDIALEYIRNHRLEHLIVMLDGATDDDLMEMCEDGSTQDLPSTRYAAQAGDPVRGDDAKPVLAGIERLLKADLPRARKEQGA